MTSQLRRASVSIAANIAEGYGRQQSKPFIQFLRAAQGSLKETETLILLADRLGMWGAPPSRKAFERCQRIGKMLVGLVRKLEAKEDAAVTIHHSPFTIHHSTSEMSNV